MKNWGITLLAMGLATFFSSIIFYVSSDALSCIMMIYILSLFLVARFTDGHRYGIICSVYGVICVNYLFTYPYQELNFSLEGYPLTFIGMLSISLITSTMTINLKRQAKILSENEIQLMKAEKETMRANLLRGISHDLRTPLTGIIGASSSYVENNVHLTEEEKLNMVIHIREDADWLLNMVENLLSVTRIDDTTATVKKTLESVEEVISEAVIRTKKRFPDIRINVTVPDEVLFVEMDAMLIEQVIINLLQNAYMYSHSDVPMELTVSRQDGHVVFRVRDYGVGIAPTRISTIFDGYSYSNEGHSDAQKGMGIGLSICKTIILAHAGNIKAINHSPGVEFCFALPAEFQEDIYEC